MFVFEFIWWFLCAETCWWDCSCTDLDFFSSSWAIWEDAHLTQWSLWCLQWLQIIYEACGSLSADNIFRLTWTAWCLSHVQWTSLCSESHCWMPLLLMPSEWCESCREDRSVSASLALSSFWCQRNLQTDRSCCETCHHHVVCSSACHFKKAGSTLCFMLSCVHQHQHCPSVQTSVFEVDWCLNSVTMIIIVDWQTAWCCKEDVLHWSVV